jgi:hypothetical protein
VIFGTYETHFQSKSKEKEIALKVEDDSNDNNGSDDEIGLLTKWFNKLLRR